MYVQQAARGHAGPKRSDIPLTDEQIHVAQPKAVAFSVDVLLPAEHTEDEVVLSVEGEIDLSTAPRLEQALLPVLEDESGPVVVDLSEVRFMDSTGVHVLVDTFRRLEPQNRSFAVVCREGSQVHHLLAVVGLLDFLAVHRSRDSAVNGGDGVLRSPPAA